MKKIINLPSIKNATTRNNLLTTYKNFTVSEDALTIGNNKSFFINTFGCQGNVADSEMMAGMLIQMGFQTSETLENADVIIINSCAIRDTAESRTFGEIGRLQSLRKINPDLIIIMAGCIPQSQTAVEKIINKKLNIDIVIGTHNLYDLPSLLMEKIKLGTQSICVYSIDGDIIEGIPKNRFHPFKAYVNIMFGCDEFCSYCIVPQTRGKERSRKEQDILNEVCELINKGYQEITLLGQNVNAYGLDLGIKHGFANLLRKLAQYSIPRIRFMTSHPHDMDDLTIETIAEFDNLMPHIHLPVQSGSDKVIKLMNRKYTQESYLKIIEKIRKTIKDVSITTDIIVGFPGETEDDFLQTIDLVKAANFDSAFTFMFSKRTGTKAFDFIEHLTIQEKKQRLQTLAKLIAETSRQNNQKLLGKTVCVLVDGVSKNNNELLTGYSKQYKLVHFLGPSSLIGKEVKIVIRKTTTWYLVGELLA